MNERLKQVREEQRMNQSEFAKKLGMGQSTLAMLEVGKRDILDRHIKTVCSIFGVNEDWLRTGHGDMYVQSKADAISQIADDFGLSISGRKILDAYLNMESEQRETIEKYLLSILETAEKENVEPSVDLLLNKQADEFAEIAREQFLQEKNQVSEISSAKELDVG